VPAQTEPSPHRGWVAPNIGGAVGSTTLVRSLNERSLLELLRSDGPTSRVDLAKITGLSKPTVSTALSNLMAYGLVEAAGAETGKPGPAAIIYRAAADIASVMSIDIGRSFIRLAIADLSGHIRVRSDVPNRAKSAASLRSSVRALIDSAQQSSVMAILGKPVVTVVGGPGIPDEAIGSMRVSGTLPGWGKQGFLNELRDSIGGVVLFENDINLAAVGEHTHGAARGLTDFVLVSIGTGIGAGIVVRNELLRGATGAAGELGFLPLGDSDGRSIDSSRPLPSVGNFEQLAAADGIVRAAHAAGLGSVESARDVFAAAREKNRKAQRVVDDLSVLVGKAISTLTIMLDPQVVLIAGGIGENFDLLQPGIERAVRAYAPTVPPIARGSLGNEASLFGGIATALPVAREAVFERVTSALRG
jgi:predicted NBD/HSP70 family sugar kinase